MEIPQIVGESRWIFGGCLWKLTIFRFDRRFSGRNRVRAADVILPTAAGMHGGALQPAGAGGQEGARSHIGAEAQQSRPLERVLTIRREHETLTERLFELAFS